MLTRFWTSFFLTKRLFWILAALVLLFVLAFFYAPLLGIAQVVFWALLLLLLIDFLFLYGQGNGLKASREMGEKLSNGDENDIFINLENASAQRLWAEVVDELPAQFQRRDFSMPVALPAASRLKLRYTLRPVKRGEYAFGALRVFVRSVLGLVCRRYSFEQQGKVVPVYPAFLQMRKYELLAISNRLTEYGIKKIRKVGHNLEFEQIKDYVIGDDIRTINWKATARRNSLMVNHYQDERAQQVYSIIDKGRSMRMPFEQMSLLDYAINASLVISKIALLKDDKAGLIAFNNRISAFVPASRVSRQMNTILQTLYHQKSAYKESDLEKLYIHVKNRIAQRSLLLLYTNFESLSSMRRQLPYFRRLAGQHLLVVILFENTELQQRSTVLAEDLEEVYIQTIAQNMIYEKQLIAKELMQYGIHSIVTTPKALTVNTINKYLELKARGLV